MAKRLHNTIGSKRKKKNNNSSRFSQFSFGYGFVAVVIAVSATILWQQTGSSTNQNIDASREFTRGVLAHRSGNLKEALSAYNSAIQASDDPPASYYHNRGGALAALGDNEAALHSFRQAVRKDPNHLGALKNLGAILIKAGGNEAEAARIFEQILGLDSPSKAAAIGNAILAYRNHAHVLPPEEACVVLEKAADLSVGRSEHAEVLSLLGGAMRQAGRVEEAVEIFERAIKLDRNKMGAWYNMGYTLQQLAQDTVCSVSAWMRFQNILK